MFRNLKKLWKICSLISYAFAFLMVCLILLSCFEGQGDSVFRAPFYQHKGPPYLTIHINEGRLGNQMFTFATLFGLSTLNGRQMKIMSKNLKLLQQYFDIHYNEVDERTFTESHPWSIGNWLTHKDRSIPLTANIIKGNVYPTSYTFFDHVRQQIRDQFRFKEIYRQHAQDILGNIKKLRPSTQVFVGVHVRRRDYLNGGWLKKHNGREADEEFFQKAVEYFRTRYQNVTFLAVSDDREWCRNNLQSYDILTMPDSPSAGHDLAFLAECNHTITTYGSYGFWGGYLSGGQVVYFTDFIKPNTSFAMNYFRYDKMYPSDWVPISTTKPGYWETF